MYQIYWQIMCPYNEIHGHLPRAVANEPSLEQPATLLTALLLCLTLSVPATLAQQSAGSRIIPVAVYELDGKFVQGIKSEQLRVKGARATVRRVQLGSGPRRMVLLLDISASMEGGEWDPARWQNAIQIAKDFLSTLQKGDRIALQVFARRHAVLAPLTEDIASLARQIDALPPPGAKSAKSAYARTTWLPDALAATLAAETELDLGDAVVLISDAELGGEMEARLGKLKPEFARRGIRLFLLVIARPGPPLTLEHTSEPTTVEERRQSLRNPMFYSEELGRFVRETGGAVLDLWDAVGPRWRTVVNLDSAITRALGRRAYDHVRYFYEVELELAAPIEKPQKITLEIFSKNGGKRKGLTLLYPKILSPEP